MKQESSTREAPSSRELKQPAETSGYNAGETCHSTGINNPHPTNEEALAAVNQSTGRANCGVIVSTSRVGPPLGTTALVEIQTTTHIMEAWMDVKEQIPAGATVRYSPAENLIWVSAPFRKERRYLTPATRHYRARRGEWVFWLKACWYNICATWAAFMGLEPFLAAMEFSAARVGTTTNVRRRS